MTTKLASLCVIQTQMNASWTLRSAALDAALTLSATTHVCVLMATCWRRTTTAWVCTGCVIVHFIRFCVFFNVIAKGGSAGAWGTTAPSSGTAAFIGPEIRCVFSVSVRYITHLCQCEHWCSIVHVEFMPSSACHCHLSWFTAPLAPIYPQTEYARTTTGKVVITSYYLLR